MKLYEKLIHHNRLYYIYISHKENDPQYFLKFSSILLFPKFKKLVPS